jgi:hypothetical protein
MSPITKISITWYAEDINHVAEQLGHKLTPTQTGDVLSLLKHKHDANIGINWDTIEFWIREVVKDA